MIIFFFIEGWVCRWRFFCVIFCSESYWEYYDLLCILLSKFYFNFNGYDFKFVKYCRGI